MISQHTWNASEVTPGQKGHSEPDLGSVHLYQYKFTQYDLRYSTTGLKSINNLFILITFYISHLTQKCLKSVFTFYRQVLRNLQKRIPLDSYLETIIYSNPGSCCLVFLETFGKSFEKQLQQKDNMIYRLQHQTWIRLIQNLRVKSTEESLNSNWLFTE